MAIEGKRKRSGHVKVSKSRYYQVQDFNSSTLRIRIKAAIKSLYDHNLRYPLRSDDKNLVYLSKRVCMKSYEDLKLSAISLKRFEKMNTILQILLKLTNKKKKFLSERGVFYKDKELFETQKQSDMLIDDVCCMLGATRRCLKIKGTPNGLVIGSLVIKENGKIYDLSNFDTLGKCISPYMFDFDIITCDAKFILVVEKEATYSALVDDDFHRKVKCVMMTGKGMPDMATRYFLRHLTKKLNNQIPVFALVDCDQHGINIMCTYTSGSDNLSFDSKNLATPNIRWLGVRPSDWDKYELTSGMADMSDKEQSRVSKFKSKVFLQDKPLWIDEIEKMGKLKKKCDLDSLTSKVVLQKLATRDWLPGSGSLGT